MYYQTGSEIIRIPGLKEAIEVSAGQIVRLEAMSNYSKIFFLNAKPMVVSKSLRWFQQVLPGQLFVRVHRSHLVNKTFVQQATCHGYNELLLHNGDCIMVSRRKRTLTANNLNCN